LTVTNKISLHGVEHRCDTTLSFLLQEPDIIGVQRTNEPAAGEHDVKCPGEKTGSVKLNIIGNYPNNEYKWLNATGEELSYQKDIDNLNAGNYQLHITYGETKSCVFEQAFDITEPAPIDAGDNISDVSCPGVTDVMFAQTPPGVKGVYNFYCFTTVIDMKKERPELVNAQNLVNVPAGWYTPVITDAKKCKRIVNGKEIKQPEPIISNIHSENPPCIAGGTGSITLDPVNSNGYRYLWNTGATEKDLFGLSIGKYIVTITDENGCTMTDSASISEPKEVQVTAVVKKDIACYGDEGIVTLTIVNARGDMSYQYAADGSAFDPQHATAGSYTIRVTDAFQCSGSTNVALNRPDKINFVRAAVTDLNCYGAGNGAISLELSGGLQPYTYQWSNQMNTPTVNNLKAGEYSVNIVDARHCGTDTSFVVTQPEKIVIHIETTDAYCPAFPDGKIVAWVNGGNEPYSYQWKELGSQLLNMDGVLSGDYTLEVTDDHQCVMTAVATVGFKQSECLDVPNVFSPNGDGANDRWNIFAGDPAGAQYALGDLYPEAIVEVYSASWGIMLYRSQKGYPEPWDGKYNGKDLPVNSYVYVIRLAKKMPVVTGNVMIIR
jgi:gliding motility-associated-like protein